MTYGGPDGDCLDIGCVCDLIEDGLDGVLYALCDVWRGRMFSRREDVCVDYVEENCVAEDGS